MRVKLKFTFSAIGASAPLIVSVCRLSNRELPNETCIIWENEGMCARGGGVTVGKEDVGYMLLMTNLHDGNYPDLHRYKYYRDKILMSFINNSRLTYNGYSEPDGANVC